MRITLESDYALRILCALAKHNSVIDAKSLSEETSVTIRFTLKILHKLVGGNLVSSFKGVGGGYLLKTAPDKISLKNVIELIDGPIAIIRCLDNQECCLLNNDKSACDFHHIFDKISFELAEKLGKISIADVINKTYKV